MELKFTSELMNSEDFKDRFCAEYYQLDNRINGLKSMLIAYKEGNLTFKPNCSYDLLNGQLKAMELYMGYLEERAIVDNIEI